MSNARSRITDRLNECRKADRLAERASSLHNDLLDDLTRDAEHAEKWRELCAVTTADASDTVTTVREAIEDVAKADAESPDLRGEPIPRGEPIHWTELRVGDVVDADSIHLADGGVRGVTIERVESDELRNRPGPRGGGWFFGPGPSWDEIRLVHRPERKLPTEPGSVIKITELKDDPLDEPIRAIKEDHNEWWYAAGKLPAGRRTVQSSSITDWIEMDVKEKEA